MKPHYSKKQILKFIDHLPEQDKQVIQKQLDIAGKEYDFATAYGLNPKQFSRSEIEMGFGQII